MSSAKPSASVRPTGIRSTTAPGSTIAAGGGTVTTAAPRGVSVSTAAPGVGTGHTPTVIIETVGGSTKTVTQSPTTNTTTSAATLTAAEQQLANSLNSRTFDACTSSADELSVNTLAAINCSATTGPPSRPLAETLAPGHAELVVPEQYERLHQQQQWHRRQLCRHLVARWFGRRATRLRLGADGVLRIVWIVDDNQVGIIAQNSDHQALYNWWKSNACAVTAAC